MGAVGHRKSIIHVNLAEFGQGAGEAAIVVLFAAMEAQVLQKGHTAGFEPAHHRGGHRPDTVGGESHRAAQCLGQGRGQGRQRQSHHPHALGPAEMAHHDDPRALVGQLGDGRRYPFDSRHIGDPAVPDRHVEVDADQHPLARDLDIVEGVENGAAVIHGPTLC